MALSLRRRPLCACLFALAFLAFLTSQSLTAEEKNPAGLEQEIARQAAAALPADLKMRAVAIGQIEGDGDGRIAHALTGELTKLNRFKVIERQDLDKLLQDQGVQARDWTDPGTRVKFGKVSGVQGLFLGKIAERKDGLFQDTLRVQLKLDDIERGQVVVAKEFVVTRWHYGPLGVLAAILLVIVGLVAGVAGRKRTVTKQTVLAEADRRERTINTEELSKAIGELSRARSLLSGKGLQAEAIRVKDLEVQLRTVKDRIALAPTGTSDRHTAGDLRRVVGFDQAYRTLSESVTRAVSGLCDHAGTGDKTQIDQDLQAITSQIREAEATFRNRGI